MNGTLPCDKSDELVVRCDHGEPSVLGVPEDVDEFAQVLNLMHCVHRALHNLLQRQGRYRGA